MNEAFPTVFQPPVTFTKLMTLRDYFAAKAMTIAHGLFNADKGRL
jgi:hypothetical protein